MGFANNLLTEICWCPFRRSWLRCLHRPSGHRTSRPGTPSCLLPSRNGSPSGSALRVTGHHGRAPPVAFCPAATGRHLARPFGSPDITAGYPQLPSAQPQRVAIWLGYRPGPSGHRTSRPGISSCLLPSRNGSPSGLALRVTGHHGRVSPVAFCPAATGRHLARAFGSPDITAGYLQLPSAQPQRVAIWLGPSGHRTSRPGTPSCLLPSRNGSPSGFADSIAASNCAAAAS